MYIFHSNLVTNKGDKFVKDVSFTVKSIFIKDLSISVHWYILIEVNFVKIMGILVEIFWRVTVNIIVVGRCFLFVLIKRVTLGSP